MDYEALEEAYNAIPAIHRASYLGLFQGYCYEEGARGEVTKFRLPDESFVLDPSDLNSTDGGFNLRDFMVTVAFFDIEGSIFYFRFVEAKNPRYDVYTDRFLYLACTEDDSWQQIEEEDTLWSTAWSHADRLTKEANV
jgi:hypothetical protein